MINFFKIFNSLYFLWGNAYFLITLMQPSRNALAVAVFDDVLNTLILVKFIITLKVIFFYTKVLGEWFFPGNRSLQWQSGDMEQGTLFVVSTPIGNLADVTLRALEVLGKVDLIASEDTRHTRILLERYKIDRPLVSYHSYNLAQRNITLVKSLKEGKSIALVSDAGTPGISDPGYQLIRDAIENDITIVPVPGPSSLLAALVASGLPMDRFVFEGFLPAKKGRKKRLEELAHIRQTLVVFEGPHRVPRLLQEILTYFGERRVVLAREVTKLYEEFYRGSIQEAIAYFTGRKPRGEFVIIIEGQPRNV